MLSRICGDTIQIVYATVSWSAIRACFVIPILKKKTWALCCPRSNYVRLNQRITVTKQQLQLLVTAHVRTSTSQTHASSLYYIGYSVVEYIIEIVTIKRYV
jgi:hypothetical protein